MGVSGQVDSAAPLITQKKAAPCPLVLVVVSDQGPETMPRYALQPLGLLYTLFSRSSHRRRQMSPRPTRRERSMQREVELLMGEKE
jgi:hypothetical protein